MLAHEVNNVYPLIPQPMQFLAGFGRPRAF
jgi:hypothetical protein